MKTLKTIGILGICTVMFILLYFLAKHYHNIKYQEPAFDKCFDEINATYTGPPTIEEVLNCVNK